MAVHPALECPGLCPTRQKIRNPPHFRYAWHDSRNYLERIDLLSLPPLQGIWTLDREVYTHPSHPCSSEKVEETGTLPHSTENSNGKGGNCRYGGRRAQQNYHLKTNRLP